MNKWIIFTAFAVAFLYMSYGAMDNAVHVINDLKENHRDNVSP